MGQPVGGVVELIGPYGVRQARRESPGLLLIVHVVLVGDGGDLPHLGTQGAQQFDLLRRLGVRHVDDAAVAAGVADVGESDACIACGTFDHDTARLQGAGTFVCADDPQSSPVLDRTAGIEEFRLAQDLAACQFGQA